MITLERFQMAVESELFTQGVVCGLHLWRDTHGPWAKVFVRRQNGGNRLDAHIELRASPDANASEGVTVYFYDTSNVGELLLPTRLATVLAEFLPKAQARFAKEMGQ